MGRPPLYHIRTHVYLNPDDLDRVAEVVGRKGVSKFIRDAVHMQINHMAPGDDDTAGQPYFDDDGGHERRLSSSGRAALFAVLKSRRMTLDQLQASLGFTDPIEFLHALLGYRLLPDHATSVILAILPKE